MTVNPLTPKVLSDSEANPSTILAKESFGWGGYWSLNHKMLVGYGIAFTITITGTASSFFLTNRAEHQAQDIHAEAIEDMQNVNHLQGSLLEFLTHKRSLLEHTATEVITLEFQEEFAHFAEDYQEFKENWQNFRQSDEFEGTEATENTTETEAEIATSIVKDHELAVKNYMRQMDRLLEQVDPSNLQPNQISLIQTSLAKLDRSAFIKKLESFIRKTSALADATEEEHMEALEVLQQASIRKRQFILTSIVLSGAIGLLVIWVVSRILLRPLQNMTEIAQQSIQEANFDLQVPVTSQDEAGILAQTFNAYMQFVNQLLVQHQTTNLQLQATLKELHFILHQGEALEIDLEHLIPANSYGIKLKINGYYDAL